MWHSSCLSEGEQGAALTAGWRGAVRGVSGGTSGVTVSVGSLACCAPARVLGWGAAEMPPPVGGAPHPCPLSADSFLACGKTVL